MTTRRRSDGPWLKTRLKARLRWRSGLGEMTGRCNAARQTRGWPRRRLSLPGTVAPSRRRSSGLRRPRAHTARTICAQKIQKGTSACAHGQEEEEKSKRDGGGSLLWPQSALDGDGCCGFRRGNWAASGHYWKREERGNAEEIEGFKGQQTAHD